MKQKHEDIYYGVSLTIAIVAAVIFVGSLFGAIAADIKSGSEESPSNIAWNILIASGIASLIGMILLVIPDSIDCVRKNKPEFVRSNWKVLLVIGGAISIAAGSAITTFLVA